MSCGETLAAAMRARGYRVTAQRTIILETIAHMGGHLTAQQVFKDARKRLPGLNLATVYRTVDSLKEAGLVDTFSTSLEPLQFSLRDPEQPHGHLVCRTCGKVQQIHGQDLEAVQRVLDQVVSFQIDHHHLTLEGLCAGCQGSGEAAGRA